MSPWTYFSLGSLYIVHKDDLRDGLASDRFGGFDDSRLLDRIKIEKGSLSRIGVGPDKVSDRTRTASSHIFLQKTDP